MNEQEALSFAQDIQRAYVRSMIAQGQAKMIETDLYRELRNSYIRGLKERVLQPFVKNESFRGAIKAFGTREFRSFDTRLREHIVCMMRNLCEKFGYTEQGAQEVVLYALDQNLAEKFP